MAFTQISQNETSCRAFLREMFSGFLKKYIMEKTAKETNQI